MKIAAFNVENLFDRAKAFNEENNSITQDILKATAELNSIFEHNAYSVADKNRIIELIEFLGLTKSDRGKFVLLRKIRGKILKRPRNKPIEVVASGRKEWIGWVELKTEPVNEIAVINTGKVIRDVNADVLAVIEAEDRVSLKKFSQYVLDKVGGETYPEIMLIDGNDDRGIDVGLLTQNNYSIKSVKSHIHDLNADENTIFSRDCPEYEIETPSQETIWVIPNHFKSKYGGNNRRSRIRRFNQAKRTAEIYQELRNDGHHNVVVLGDLNDTPDSHELSPLLKDTDLKDVSKHQNFDSGKFSGIGTYGLGNDSQKIDYLLLSPNLFDKVIAAGLFRKGAWPGKRPVRWEVYDDIKKEIHVASDHHVIWAEIDI